MESMMQCGDVLRFCRGEYSHVALYMGNGRVIHLWSPVENDFSVRIDELDDVLQSHGGTNEVRNCTDDMDVSMHMQHNLEPLEADAILERAQSRLGETRYDYLQYNCEHFVTWARYGYGASPQVRSHTNQVLAGALLGAAVGGMAGFVVGGILSLFTKVDALTASAGAASVGLNNHASAVRSSHRRSHRSALQAESVESDESSSGDESSEDQSRAERQRLWEDLEATSAQVQDNWRDYMDHSTSMVERIRSSSRPARNYSDERHEALAARLAEEGLACGICYYDLLRVKAVAFACDHFTCAGCYDALHRTGNKCCPYCRIGITDVQIIHTSTKLQAKAVLLDQAHDQ